MLSGRHPFGFWAIRPYTFKFFLFWLCPRLWPLATFIDVSGYKAWTGQIFSTSERATPTVSFKEEHVGAFLTLYTSAI